MPMLVAPDPQTAPDPLTDLDDILGQLSAWLDALDRIQSRAQAEGLVCACEAAKSKIDSAYALVSEAEAKLKEWEGSE